jgi:hypothetical protein
MSTRASHHTCLVHCLTLFNPFILARTPLQLQLAMALSLPITHTACSSIPTNYHSLLLRNILLSPDLVENLITVSKLMRDNLVSIEFDPFSFSINDLQTSTLSIFGRPKPSMLPPPLSSFGTSDWDTPATTAFFKLSVHFNLIFSVINLPLTPARPANLVSM